VRVVKRAGHRCDDLSRHPSNCSGITVQAMSSPKSPREESEELHRETEELRRETEELSRETEEAGQQPGGAAASQTAEELGRRGQELRRRWEELHRRGKELFRRSERRRAEIKRLKSRHRTNMILFMAGAAVTAITPWVWLLEKPPMPTGRLYLGFIIVVVAWAAVWVWALLRRFRSLPAAFIAALVVLQAVYVEGFFALWYRGLSAASPQAFNGPLSPVDAAYFTISTATTTGMGDIHPSSPAARLIVTAQMIASLYLIVIAITTAVQRVLAPAVHETQQQHRPSDEPPQEPPESDHT
jgi:hypothetical protein